jgi:hypothetical protein
VSASFLTFCHPKEFSFSFLAEGFIEHAYGDYTYIGYELLTQNPDLSYRCTVHILDTKCVGEYNVWRAGLSAKLETQIKRQRFFMICHKFKNVRINFF